MLAELKDLEQKGLFSQVIFSNYTLKRTYNQHDFRKKQST